MNIWFIFIKNSKGEHAMLFNIRKVFYDNTHQYLKIVNNSGRFGIENTDKDEIVIPLEYDNIFIYGTNLFVLYKKGKLGAVRIDEEPIVIADCTYDVIETFGHDLIFSSNQKVRYYNSVTNAVRDFAEIIVETPFLYCKDERHQYILYGELGKEIYKKEYTSYSESCFCFCGNTEKGPVFYDARYSAYLYPAEDGYKVYEELFNHPIIINRKNVCNITEGENGIGVIDSYGNVIMENKYDSVKAELKITAIKENETEQKIIPFQKEVFEKGMVSELEDWI